MILLGSLITLHIVRRVFTKMLEQNSDESLEQDHKPSTKDGAGNYR